MAINGSTTPRFCLPLLVFTCLALGSASMPAASLPPEASSVSLRGTLALNQPVAVYNSWSAYDELSDNIELTETLAMKELKEILRLRRAGVRIDYYLNGIN